MKGILRGCIDLHVHTIPDVIPRLMSDLELAREAASCGMAAILVKSHHLCTTGSAYAASQAVPGIKVFGGIALNYSVGGLNPAAVEAALKTGARQVWLPTLSAQNHLACQGKQGGIAVLDGTGAVKKELMEIFSLIAQYGGILGTGHISSRETAVLVPEAITRGVQKIIITHPELPSVNMSVNQQLELKKMGVFFERCYVCTTPPGGNVGLQAIFDGIRLVGSDCTVISTDFGQTVNPSPVAGMERYMKELLELGVSETEIFRMAGHNPAQLLDI